ncbi:MAG: Crp/Fnr family transcriptional regulator [Rhodospirillales bacterium]|jgi:CRP/FNR family cyclic AMP-dependent transcriptional regulator
MSEKSMPTQVLSNRSLASIKLLTSLSNKNLIKQEELCQWRTCSPSDQIIQSGEETQDVYFLVSGSVNVLNYTDSGRVISFASLGSGDYFGHLAAIDKKPRSATVVAATHCELAILTGAKFRNLVDTEPKISFFLLERMSAIIRLADERIFNFSQLGATQRVCLELLRLAQYDQGIYDGWTVQPVPTQTSIAGMVGTTRRTVARVMHQLYSEGIVERKFKVLYICDKQHLENAALQIIY